MMNENEEIETAPVVAAVDTTAEETTTTTPTSPPPKSPGGVAVHKTEDGGYATEVGKFHFEVEAKQVPLVGLFLASFVFMIAAIARKGPLGRWYGYALSIGIVGMFLALVDMVLLKYKSEVDQKYSSYLNLLWSVVGAVLMTFGEAGKFTETGNGTYAVLFAMK
jgi:hypothetical protein